LTINEPLQSRSDGDNEQRLRGLIKKHMSKKVISLQTCQPCLFIMAYLVLFSLVLSL